MRNCAQRLMGVKTAAQRRRMIKRTMKASGVIQEIGTIVPISQLPEGVVRELVALPNY